MADEKEVSEKSHIKFSTIVKIAALIAAVGIVMMYWGDISSFSSTYYQKATVYVSSLMQVINPNPTDIQKQYQQIWGTPTASAPAESSLSASFDIVSKKPLEAIAKINALTKRDITMAAQCLIDGVPVDVSQQQISLPKNDINQQTAVTCKGTEAMPTGKNVELRLGLSDSVSSPLSFYRGTGNKTGPIPVSTMTRQSPYSLALEMPYSQPLEDKDYDLLVKIKREDSNANLTAINSLRIFTKVEGISIDCPYGEALSGDRAAISKWLVNSQTDGYIIHCNVDVNGATDKNKLVVIESEFNYTAEKSFKGTI